MRLLFHSLIPLHIFWCWFFRRRHHQIHSQKWVSLMQCGLVSLSLCVCVHVWEQNMAIYLDVPCERFKWECRCNKIRISYRFQLKCRHRCRWNRKHGIKNTGLNPILCLLLYCLTLRFSLWRSFTSIHRSLDSSSNILKKIFFENTDSYMCVWLHLNLDAVYIMESTK